MSVRTRYQHGVTIDKKDKVCPGYVLYTPMIISRKQLQGKDSSTVYLIDEKGRIVHYWTVPGAIKLHAELLENGHILCAIDDPSRPKPAVKLAFNIHSVLELDWDSNIVWRYDNDMMDCHDRCRLRNGNTLVQTYKAVPMERQRQVKGGIPGTENKGIADASNEDDFGWRLDEEKPGEMYTLVLQEVDPAGAVVWEMDLSQALDPEIDEIMPFCGRELWPGLNSIEEMPDGNIISTSYNLSTVFIWDKATKTVKWRFGNKNNNPTKHRVSFPHDPTVLANGHILFFENGRYFSADPDGSQNFFPPEFSRVVEVDPETKDIVWEYRAENPVEFYSTYISSARRLSNGNTLICEGALGRFFEVTPDKEVVWEYISPFYTETNSRYGKMNAVFRAMKYEPDYPGLAGKTFDLAKTDRFNRLFGPDAFDI